MPPAFTPFPPPSLQQRGACRFILSRQEQFGRKSTLCSLPLLPIPVPVSYVHGRQLWVPVRHLHAASGTHSVATRFGSFRFNHWRNGSCRRSHPVLAYFFKLVGHDGRGGGFFQLRVSMRRVARMEYPWRVSAA